MFCRISSRIKRSFKRIFFKVCNLDYIYIYIKLVTIFLVFDWKTFLPEIFVRDIVNGHI